MQINTDLSSKCTFIKHALYTTENQILDINFTSKNSYRYFNVPRFIFDGFIHSDLPGKYFRHAIRDIFECEKLI